ncbi:transmembrane protein 256 [Trematomus bernacchii]|uniref:transmembrane protein 256 n=1 Tax=Trematomus bernacchii TaxID=40690 RepID=UPI00146F5B79|nr:transmembrane protein 256 [Trematomus bernacchii]
MTAAVVVRRLAALSGASAAAAVPYGAHGFKNSDPDSKFRRALFEMANKYHFYHSLALLGAAHSSKPAVAGTLHDWWYRPCNKQDCSHGGCSYDRWLAGYNSLNCNSSRPLHRAAL